MNGYIERDGYRGVQFGVWDALQHERGIYTLASFKCAAHGGTCRLLQVRWPDGEVTDVCSTRIAPVTAEHLQKSSVYKDDFYIKHGASDER